MRIIKKGIYNAAIFFFAIFYSLTRKRGCLSGFHLGFLTNEFFHSELGGYGGYGMTLKIVTEHFNRASEGLRASVLLTINKKRADSKVRKMHEADIFYVPAGQGHFMLNYLKFASLCQTKNFDAVVSIGYQSQYDYFLRGFPALPWIIWLKDPRDEFIWEKICDVPLELKFLKKSCPQDFKRMLDNERSSFKEILNLSKRSKRKIFVSAEFKDLFSVAHRLYGPMDEMKHFLLPKPIPVPEILEVGYSQKPSFLFLGRLDPVKRPWLYFDIAKRCPEYDFYVAGMTHFKEGMDEIICKYQTLKNLKFLNLVLGDQKTQLLNSIWAVINTSVHEALPVSFLEAFSHGKCVIACQNPDDLCARYGIYVGEILGNGSQGDVDKFEAAIKHFVSSDFKREKIGNAAYYYVKENHSFENFKKIIFENIR
ncbi:MAG: glycosyltransferase [Candidatus Omnitrophica bacterium]|nr:glycosyltransferase [Candidatus Omnitrophota bacterium]